MVGGAEFSLGGGRLPRTRSGAAQWEQRTGGDHVRMERCCVRRRESHADRLGWRSWRLSRQRRLYLQSALAELVDGKPALVDRWLERIDGDLARRDAGGSPYL